MLLVDTNVWLAAADRRSLEHLRWSELLRERHTELASTSLVVAETAWLLLDRFGPAAQRRFVSTIVGSQVDLVELVAEDWTRILELISTYSDLSLDVVDASTVAVAERLGLGAVATMDERDFRVIRPVHVESFDLLPGPAYARTAADGQTDSHRHQLLRASSDLLRPLRDQFRS